MKPKKCDNMECENEFDLDIQTGDSYLKVTAGDSKELIYTFYFCCMKCSNEYVDKYLCVNGGKK